MRLDDVERLQACSKSVLVVDDDQQVRETFESLLRSEGYHVACCSNGQEALSRLRSGPLSDLILLDLRMPVMDGWSFRIEQKRDPRLAPIPIIAVSGDHTPMAKAIDAKAFLAKPVDCNALLATVDRVLTDQERSQYQAQLLEADRLSALGLLAAGVAHEINQPLTFVMANVEFVLKEMFNDRDRHQCLLDGLEQCPNTRCEQIRLALRRSREGLDRIRNLVHEVRSFSSPAGPEPSWLDVRQVLDASSSIVRSKCRNRAQLIKDYQEVPPVLANEARLGQVFLNLLLNAVQAIPEGQPQLNQIRLLTRLGSDGGVIVEVSDSGVGIAPEVLGRIFEPFYTTKPIGEGTGLGLTICERLVRELGGTLLVQSEVGRGSSFRVQLPPALVPTAKAPSSAPEPEPSQPSRAQVLILDDEEIICFTFEQFLIADYDVTTSTNARAALELIRSGRRFDAILCDLSMPGMSGMQFFEELQTVAVDQAQRTMFLTGGACTASSRAFLESVPQPCLEKPVSLETLRNAVAEQLQSGA